MTEPTLQNELSQASDADTTAAAVFAPTAIASVNTLAAYLLDGYWEWSGSSRGHWDSDTVTINITGLTASEQDLAVRAFLVWEDVCDITFVPTSGTANITFVNTGSSQAVTNTTASSGLLTSATITVRSDWDVGAAGGVNSYFFQTYVHEIGHALGLGHQGPYNGTADYDVDAIFVNDTWRWSVMSYNDQDDADFGDTKAYVITPQMADILAVQSLYGAAQTRAGDTVYGFNSTAGAHYDFAQYFDTPAFTIFDWSGSDTLDTSGYGDSQTISLAPGTWSSIGGETNNVGIYLDTFIENANGGFGGDIISGNGRLNVLRGNGGDDALFGLGGDDFLFGGAGDDILDGGDDLDTADFTDITVGGVSVNLNTGTAFGVQSGTDALISIERVNGTLAGDDIFFGNDVDNVLDGNGGDDTFIGSLGNDVLLGEDGIDTVDYSGLAEGITVDLQEQIGYQSATTATGKSDKLYQIEHAIGSAFRDVLTGSNQDNMLIGGSGNDDLFGLNGNDTLDGGPGADTMAGGTGDDTYYVDSAGDFIVEAPGEGDNDAVFSTVDHFMIFTEILTLLEQGGAINGTGNTGNETLFGNSFANTLRGGDGNDTLDGGAGDDVLRGEAGDDTYFVDNIGDQTIENADEGTDTVRASITHALAPHIENLILLDAGGAIEGTGNGLGNAITGNASANTLRGGGGNDTLDGGGGNDTLDGGADTDTAVYSGNRLDYFLRYIAATQTFEITDLRAGAPEGADTAANVEQFRFADVMIAAIAVNAQQSINADGSQTIRDIANEQSWSFYTESYDGSGNRVAQAGVNDNGSSWLTNFDAANAQPWTWFNDQFNAAGQRTSQIGLNDDGSNWQAFFDVDNAQPWTWYKNDYASSGPRSMQTGLNDDGSHWQVTFDAANNQPWTWVNNEYSAAGARTTQIGLNDDGSNWQVLFDHDNTRPWVWQNSEFAVNGKRIVQTGLNDDGSNWQTFYDATGNQSWAWVRNEFAAAGPRTGQRGLNDDGSSWTVFFDHDGSQPWIWHSNQFDAAGRRTKHIGLNDDGSNWETMFDATNAEAWTWIRNEFSAAGPRTSQVGLNDDGSNWQTLYDVDDAYEWLWQRTDYDAGGNVISRHGVNDDGTVWSV